MLLQLGSRAQAPAPIAAPCLSLDLPIRYCCTSVIFAHLSFHASHPYTQACLVTNFLMLYFLKVFFSTFPTLARYIR